MLRIFNISRLTSHVSRGFTLIELLVVLTILSISLSFVVPRLAGREDMELRSSARRLLYTARQLSDEALFKKEKRVLSIDMEKQEYWEGSKKTRLPGGVSMEEVKVGKENVNKNIASITFFPSGFRDEAEIQLTGRGKGKGYTVIIPALGERFEIRER
jgi:prepilin-type N-terminal cleavage/methylation domain-containing protein